MITAQDLPQVRGRYQFNKALKTMVWFRVGGPADVVFKPADVEDLQHFLKHLPPHIPLFPMGVGSNLLIRDGGVEGVVVKLGGAFNYCKVDADLLIAGAATLDKNVALWAADEGVSNLTFLATIPGTIGGALRMNAGCYGQEIKDMLAWAEAVDEQGQLHRLTNADMGFRYRTCQVPPRWVFTKAAFNIERGAPKEIHQKIAENQAQRDATQPTSGRTGGSTFKNPLPHSAWQLIDKVGGRGLTVGGAQVSEKHCNFLINTGTATAHDIETLGEELRQRVRTQCNIDLHWEIKRVGRE